jgi:hypothetical protein
LERLASNKHSSLLQKYTNYVRKKFYKISSPCGILGEQTGLHSIELLNIVIIKVNYPITRLFNYILGLKERLTTTLTKAETEEMKTRMKSQHLSM